MKSCKSRERCMVLQQTEVRGLLNYLRWWPVRKDYSVGGQSGEDTCSQAQYNLNFLFKKMFSLSSFFSGLASFLYSPPLCSQTSLAARRLIEMCKSLWHGMNRQLLAGCPMPLCVLPLNWSAPVHPPSSLPLPTLTVRFFLTSKTRLCVPSEGSKSTMRPTRSFLKRNKLFLNNSEELKLTESSHWFSIQWQGLQAQHRLWVMVMFHLQVNMQVTAT